MQLSLIVTDGKHAGKSVRVKGSKFSIGRAPDCDLRAKSRQISRHHCIIEIGEQQVTIRDLGSRNGTLVNDKKIEAEYSLSNGDRLTVGRFELKVKMTPDAAATAGTSSQSVTESQPADEVPAQAASISGIALSIMESIVESSDDNFELEGKSADSQASFDSKDDQPTQSFTWPKGQPDSTEKESSESTEDSESPASNDPSEYVVSEAEKEAARTNRGIVGVSKTAQAKRVTGTSHEAAAEALRRFNR